MFSFAALISGAFSLGGRAAPYIDPAAINAVRFALAVLVMAIFVNQTASWKRDHASAPWRYLVMGFLLSLYFVLMFRSLQITDPVSTGAVFTLTPLMSAGFGSWWGSASGMMPLISAIATMGRNRRNKRKKVKKRPKVPM